MRNRSPKHDHNNHHRTFSLYSLKLFLFLLAICIALFVIFQIQSLQTPPPPSLFSHPSSWAFIHEWQNFITNTITGSSAACVAQEAKADAAAAANDKLRRAVTFLPLKDLRYAKTAQQGHTWFMSSMYDTQEEGEVQYQQFPSEASNGSLLCIKGRDNHDGARNSYALAWPETLPYNAILKKGLTFVSNNHYNYVNIWHALSNVVPLVGWHIKNGCLMRPTRWVLYHWGELRIYMSPWVQSLMEATFNVPVDIEGFDNGASGGGGGSGEEEERAVCFEEAVVTRHNEGGMSSKRKLEVYDLMRCKAREYCNVSLVVEGGAGRQGVVEIGMTMLVRTGSRAFRNQSAVVGIFQRECKKVNGCRLRVTHSDNLTFCDQVKLMSLTDILVSPHGAQLANLFLMDRNGSVMEFFPKGWLELAGAGQYVFHWLSSWSGMNHRGAWWDPDGDQCPYGDDVRRCMSFYKNGLIGYNETFFAEWARNVLNDVKVRKMEEASKNGTIVSLSDSGCACSS